MRIITLKALKEEVERHPDARSSVDNWLDNTLDAQWTDSHEMKAVFPYADNVGSCTVFNIAGNKYRLIARVFYADKVGRPGKRPRSGRVYYLDLLTHAEYSKEKWKAKCDC
jgi:mRNA interferase HigB